MWRLLTNPTLVAFILILSLKSVLNYDHEPPPPNPYKIHQDFDGQNPLEGGMIDGHHAPSRRPPPRGRPPPGGPHREPGGERPHPPPAGEDTLSTIFMEDHCRLHIRRMVLDDARIYVDDAVHVELAKDHSYQRQFACLVTFSTRDPDWRLMLHFEQVDINYNPGTVDRFRIYDGIDAHKELTPARGLYGKYSKGAYEFSSGNIHDYVSSGSALTLYFIGSPSDSFSGFKLLLTVFKDPLLSGECETGYMKCVLNGYCISESMLCNGAQNCGENDLSDSHNCYSKDHDRDPHILHGSADLGLMVGCALSIIILMVVVIWLGIICMKKKGLPNLRQYMREDTTSDTHLTPDGSIVEPAEIHRVASPPVSFMEPPPLYSENDIPHTEQQREEGYVPNRFELPPPYSPLDERDTAGLILNESAGGGLLPRIPILPPGYNQSTGRNSQEYSQPSLRVHRLGRRRDNPPIPPVRTSSNPPYCGNGHVLRLRRNSGSHSGFRPLRGVTRQSIPEEQAVSPPGSTRTGSAAIGNAESSNCGNALFVDVATDTQSLDIQTDAREHALNHNLDRNTTSQLDNQNNKVKSNNNDDTSILT